MRISVAHLLQTASAGGLSSILEALDFLGETAAEFPAERPEILAEAHEALAAILPTFPTADRAALLMALAPLETPQGGRSSWVH